MRKRIRFLLFIFSLIVSVTALLMTIQLLDPSIGTVLLLWIQRLAETTGPKAIAVAVSLIIAVAGIFCMAFALMSGRLRKTRVRTNETGAVDIGIDAIVSIALNSAKLAQVGVKSAKARVYAAKNNAIRLVIEAVLYSDVEIQSQMAVLQDRVKKDVERYTGIPVASVEVKVARVELIGAKIEN